MTGSLEKRTLTLLSRKRCLVSIVRRPQSPLLPGSEIAHMPENARNRESPQLFFYSIRNISHTFTILKCRFWIKLLNHKGSGNFEGLSPEPQDGNAAADSLEQVVEVVCHAAGELTDGLYLLHLHKLGGTLLDTLLQVGVGYNQGVIDLGQLGRRTVGIAQQGGILDDEHDAQQHASDKAVGTAEIPADRVACARMPVVDHVQEEGEGGKREIQGEDRVLFPPEQQGRQRRDAQRRNHWIDDAEVERREGPVIDHLWQGIVVASREDRGRHDGAAGEDDGNSYGTLRIGADGTTHHGGQQHGDRKNRMPKIP